MRLLANIILNRASRALLSWRSAGPPGPGEKRSEGGRDDRGIPYPAESIDPKNPSNILG